MVDTTAPTVTSRTVNGSTLDVTYSEPLNAGSAPAGSDFTVSVNGSGDAVDAVAFAGGNTIVRLTLHNPVHFLDTVTVAYRGSAIQDRPPTRPPPIRPRPSRTTLPTPHRTRSRSTRPTTPRT